jgi:hypothetical protein
VEAGPVQPLPGFDRTNVTRSNCPGCDTPARSITSLRRSADALLTALSTHRRLPVCLRHPPPSSPVRGSSDNPNRTTSTHEWNDGAFTAGSRGRVHRQSDSLRRQLRPRQPPLHQRPLRGTSQSRAGHPDRDPDRPAGHWVPVGPGGRFQCRLQGLQRLLRDDSSPPEQARRKTVAACLEALTKRGAAVLIAPADISNAPAHDELPYTVHARRPVVRPPTPISTRSPPSSTRPKRLRSTPAPAARGPMTRWSRRRRGSKPRWHTPHAARTSSNTTIPTTRA